ncbi:putative ribonuclease H-like domain-containing protein [Tanacetum coccineum]
MLMILQDVVKILFSHLNHFPTIDPKDKGKGVLKESTRKECQENDMECSSDCLSVEIARMLLDYKWKREREIYTIEERSKLLAEFLKRRKKLLAEERAAAVRNKPPTRTKLRSLMMTYLKHTEVLKSTKVEVRRKDLRNIKKRLAYLKIVPDEEEEINYEVLGMRANGSSRYIKTFTEMVSRFDRLVFIELHKFSDEDAYLKFTALQKRYPLIRETLEKMIELRLTTKTEEQQFGHLITMLTDIQNWLSQRSKRFCTKSVPSGSIQIPSGETTISTGSVPVPTGSPTDSFSDDEPTTRFPTVQTRSKVNKTPTSESAFISYIHDQQRSNYTDFQHCLFACFLSQVEPRSVAQTLEDPSWADAMQEEMQQFKFQNVWVLADLPEDKYAIGTKWILKNKRDARGIVVRNKARLVAQGHLQRGQLINDESFAPLQE